MEKPPPSSTLLMVVGAVTRPRIDFEPSNSEWSRRAYRSVPSCRRGTRLIRRVRPSEVLMMAPEENLDAFLGEDLFAAAAEAAKTVGLDSDDQWRYVRALHRRPQRQVFKQAVAWCASVDAVERI